MGNTNPLRLRVKYYGVLIHCGEKKRKKEKKKKSFSVSLVRNYKPLLFTVFLVPLVGKYRPTTSLNDYIRDEAGLSGTKVMCREAGCGCCAISVTTDDPLGTGQKTQTINSVSGMKSGTEPGGTEIGHRASTRQMDEEWDRTWRCRDKKQSINSVGGRRMRQNLGV